jgi:sugar-specific transcriptional regulator TrmB
MYIEELINAGLKEKEALIYNSLLSSGMLPVNEIIKKTNLKRGIVYKTLYDLIEKDLVSETIKNKKLHFKAEHPFKLSDFVEEKYKEAQKNQTTLATILPQLVSSFKASGNKPGIKIYEGIRGIKDVYMDTIYTNQKIYSILQTSEVNTEIYEWLNNVYAPIRVENKIWADVILTEEGESTKEYLSYNPTAFRETRVIPQSQFPIGIEMNIYGDKVAFINFNKNSDLFAIVVQNPFISNTQKALFDLAWETAGNYLKK